MCGLNIDFNFIKQGDKVPVVGDLFAVYLKEDQ